MDFPNELGPGQISGSQKSVTVSDAGAKLTYVRHTGDESILHYDIEVVPYAERTDEDLPGTTEIEEEFKRIRTAYQIKHNKK